MKPLNFPVLLILSTILLVFTSPAYTQPGTVQANGISIAFESFGDIDNEAIIMIQGTGGHHVALPFRDV